MWNHPPKKNTKKTKAHKKGGEGNTRLLCKVLDTMGESGKNYLKLGCHELKKHIISPEHPLGKRKKKI